MADRKTLMVLALLALGYCFACRGKPQVTHVDTRDEEHSGAGVLLVHGFGQSADALGALETCLTADGYWVAVWEHPSLQLRVQQLATQLAVDVTRIADEHGLGRVHLVGHSMGGVIVRDAITNHPLPEVKRAVLLAPPNQGTPTARKAGEIVPNDAIPALEDLSTNPHSRVRTLPPLPARYAVGVIAVAADRTVPPQYTRVEGQDAHILMKGTTHTGMLDDSKTCTLVRRFLARGTFDAEQVDTRALPGEAG